MSLLITFLRAIIQLQLKIIVANLATMVEKRGQAWQSSWKFIGYILEVRAPQKGLDPKSGYNLNFSP